MEIRRGAIDRSSLERKVFLCDKSKADFGKAYAMKLVAWGEKENFHKTVTVSLCDRKRFSESLKHEPGNSCYNPDMRQLIHVAYKLAGLQIKTFYRLLEANENIVSNCVYDNIYNRHICRLFDLK